MIYFVNVEAHIRVLLIFVFAKIIAVSFIAEASFREDKK